MGKILRASKSGTGARAVILVKNLRGQIIMYQFKIFVNGTQEVRGEAKVYHAAMMEAIRYMAQYKKDGKIKLVFEEI